MKANKLVLSISIIFVLSAFSFMGFAQDSYAKNFNCLDEIEKNTLEEECYDQQGTAVVILDEYTGCEVIKCDFGQTGCPSEEELERITDKCIEFGGNNPRVYDRSDGGEECWRVVCNIGEYREEQYREEQNLCSTEDELESDRNACTAIGFSSSTGTTNHGCEVVICVTECLTPFDVASFENICLEGGNHADIVGDPTDEESCLLVVCDIQR